MSLQKYVDYLCKRKENASDRNDSQEPVRGFKDNWSLEEIGGDPSVQPSDEYASLFKTLQDAEQHVVDDRLCDFLLRSDDPDLVHDLRANNGKLINPDLNPFWTALQNILDEESVTHERRQSSTCFLPFAFQ